MQKVKHPTTFGYVSNLMITMLLSLTEVSWNILCMVYAFLEDTVS